MEMRRTEHIAASYDGFIGKDVEICTRFNHAFAVALKLKTRFFHHGLYMFIDGFWRKKLWGKVRIAFAWWYRFTWSVIHACNATHLDNIYMVSNPFSTNKMIKFTWSGTWGSAFPFPSSSAFGLSSSSILGFVVCVKLLIPKFHEP